MKRRTKRSDQLHPFKSRCHLPQPNCQRTKGKANPKWKRPPATLGAARPSGRGPPGKGSPAILGHSVAPSDSVTPSVSPAPANPTPPIPKRLSISIVHRAVKGGNEPQTAEIVVRGLGWRTTTSLIDTNSNAFVPFDKGKAENPTEKG